jgi:hypothetical protein
MSNPRLTYIPLPDATPETEAVALAAIYRYAIDRYQNKKAGVSITRDDEKGANDEFLATPRIPQ